jgi:multimeric flavodoxin WrbA
MATILILKGSPHVDGNTAALADKVQAAAEAEGASVESVFLNALDIRPCNGCGACRETGACVVKDDMQGLYPKLRAADAIVFASPIYWFTYTAQLKTCIDRFYAMWSNDNDAFKGKSVGVLLTYGNADPYSSGAINAIHTFESMLRFIGADLLGCVHGSAPSLESAVRNQELMRQAARLGKRLAQISRDRS